jgi:hypothetical protein
VKIRPIWSPWIYNTCQIDQLQDFRRGCIKVSLRINSNRLSFPVLFGWKSVTKSERKKTVRTNKTCFQSSPQGRPLTPRIDLFPLGVKLSSSGEGPQFAPPILLKSRVCSPLGPLGLNEGVNILPRGQSLSLGTKFNPRNKIMLIKTGPDIWWPSDLAKLDNYN